MNWNLEKMRLLAADSLKDLSSGERDKLVKGMREVPVAKMIDAVNFIDKNLLPAVKKKSGDKSADFEFFTNVIDYLLWAIVIVDRYETLEMKWTGQKLEIQVLREYLQIYEKEIGKYTALEDLMLSSSLDLYAKRIKDAAADRLKIK
jgi:hypothetical protein